MTHQLGTKEKKRVSHLEKQLNARIDKLLTHYGAESGRGIYKAKRDAIRKMRKHVVNQVVSLFDRARLVSVANGHEKLLRDDFRCALASERLLCRETGRRRNRKLLDDMVGHIDDDAIKEEESTGDDEIHETLRLAHSDSEPVYEGDGRWRNQARTFHTIIDTAQRRRHDELLEWHRERVARHVKYARHLQRALRRLASD